ncbi:MAG: hypothetical protein AAF984_07020 [Verrucomicrobiota bacterium]
MSSYRRLAAILVVAALFHSSAYSEQPVFSEMPRWDNGWGFQIVEEYRTESELLDGEDKLGSGLSEDVHIMHLEGVYTWDKSIRLTFKLPYVIAARRELLQSNGGKEVQHDSGLGDLTLALPLKRYFNYEDRSGSWTLAPQLKVPLADDDEYEVYDGVWGHGLSLGYEAETYRWIFGVGSTTWIYHHDEPFETELSLKLGLNIQAFGSSGSIKWKSKLHYEGDDSTTLTAGPVLYWKFTETIHTQFQWQHDFYDYQGKLDHGRGDSFKLGFGFVF